MLTSPRLRYWRLRREYPTPANTSKAPPPPPQAILLLGSHLAYRTPEPLPLCFRHQQADNLLYIATAPPPIVLPAPIVGISTTCCRSQQHNALALPCRLGCCPFSPRCFEWKFRWESMDPLLAINFQPKDINLKHRDPDEFGKPVLYLRLCLWLPAGY